MNRALARNQHSLSIVLFALLLGLLLIALWRYPWPNFDFDQFWKVGQRFLNGENPYLVTRNEFSIHYPPLLFLLLAPPSFLSAGAALLVWLSAGACACFYIIFSVLKEFDCSAWLKVAPSIRWPLLIAVLATWFPLLLYFALGQSTLIPLAGFILKFHHNLCAAKLSALWEDVFDDKGAIKEESLQARRVEFAEKLVKIWNFAQIQSRADSIARL